MAYWTTSALLASQSRILGSMTEPELRRLATPTMATLLKNQQFLQPGLADIKPTDSRTNSTYILDKSSHSVGSARAYNHTGSKGASTKVDLTWTTHSADFNISLKNADNNLFNWNELFDNEVKSALIALHENMESTATAWLNTNRTQDITPTTPLTATWDDSAYIVGVAAADADYFVQVVKAFMWENKYKGMLDMVCDPKLYVILERALYQGDANSTNLGFQFQNVNIMPTTGAVATAIDGYTGLCFVFPSNTVGAMNWIPRLNREGKQTNLYTYDAMGDLFGLPITWATHVYETGADSQSLGGERQDVDEEWEFSTDISMLKAPIPSGTNESTIYKFGLLST